MKPRQPRHSTFAPGILLGALVIAGSLCPANLAASITYVQGNYATPQTPETTVTISFTAAQAAGDLNVVVVGWNDTTATVKTITDKGGNTYTLAVGPTLVSGSLSQSIYYAKKIVAAAAGANSVTVTFSAAAVYPDIRILEYGGADQSSPVDVAASATGSSATSTSASATTTNATDLIFGANIVATSTKAAGSGFTKRLLTSPDGDIAEDKTVTTTGSYNATASLTSSGPWIMQMVAFHTPVVSSGSFTISASPTSVTVAQGNQGTSTITTAVSGGFSNSIGLTASGAPTGTTVSFNPSTIAAPGAGTSTMTVSVGASTAAGTYSITVMGSGGGVQETTTVGLTVTATPNFTLSASPTSVTVAPGNQGTSTITTTVSGGFSNAISLSSSGEPSSTTVGFNPSTIAAPGSGSSTMTITVGSSTALGTYPITVTANGGGSQKTVTVTLNVAVAAPTISYVQGNYSTPQTAQTTVTTAFTKAQTAGDLNVVVVGWNNTTSTVKTITDSSGNTYALAVGPTALSGALSQSIYYAKNIASAAAGANTVTVTFSAAAAYPDIRILEYSGPSTTSPVDVTAGASGTSTSSSSGAATTTNATDLIFGANIVTTTTSGPGSGFTQRLLTSPDEDIAEDEMVTATGSYSATAPLGSSGGWIMQMVAFRTSGGVQPPTAPTNLTATAAGASQINLSWTVSTSSIGIANYIVERCQGSGCTNFAQVATPTGTTYSDTGLAANTSYSYEVQAKDTQGNLSGFSNVASATTQASTGGEIIYQQGNYATPQSPQSTVTITFNSAQTAGDLNVVVVGWNDTAATVSTISDTSGNTYTLAVGPTLFGSSLTQSVYYAKNIAAAGAGTNSVTVTFSKAAAYPDIRILEYSGVDPTNPLDVTVAGTGSSNGSSSGPATTTNATDLIFGANIVQTTTTGPGTGFTKRLLTSPDTDIAEDETTTSAGSYTATAPLGSAGGWIMQMVAFRAASGGSLPFSVSPRQSVVTFTETQQFTASGGSGTITWSVDGAAGGSSATGTITTSGLYTPPSSVGSHTITATPSQGQAASATIYISNYAGTYTYHNDNLRSGVNSNETVLTPTNVNATQFGKLFAYGLDGIAFASPLYVANVSIPGQGSHNVVYVATENDSVYAFDADDRSSSPLWHVSLIPSGDTTIPCTATGECGDIPTQIGITSTPVIDSSSGTMYVVSNTKEGSSYVQRLHALDITTGAEKFGGPVVIQGSVTGTGSGASGGKVPYDALRENQRPGLLLSNGIVYLAAGSHGDNSPWHGWVLGYNATTLKQTMVYNSTPNDNGGGIWQGGGGLATDATGDIYFTTSNGGFDVNTGGVDYGDSIEKLTPSGTVADYFTPYDQANMSTGNLDLGAGGPVLLVDQTTGSYPHLLIASGKTGTIYVINRDNMGHYNANNDDQVVQTLIGALANGGAEGGNYSTPVFFNNWVYFASTDDYLKAFKLTDGLLSTTPTSESPETYPCRGGSFAISANGTSNGIVWAIENLGDPNNDGGTPGVLIAYDATNLIHEFYNSNQAGGRDTMDYPAKFGIPVVANGKVFVAGQTQLVVYGLLP